MAPWGVSLPIAASSSTSAPSGNIHPAGAMAEKATRLGSGRM